MAVPAGFAIIRVTNQTFSTTQDPDDGRYGEYEERIWQVPKNFNTITVRIDDGEAGDAGATGSASEWIGEGTYFSQPGSPGSPGTPGGQTSFNGTGGSPGTILTFQRKSSDLVPWQFITYQVGYGGEGGAGGEGGSPVNPELGEPSVIGQPGAPGDDGSSGSVRITVI
jgi:hypothetical protein